MNAKIRSGPIRPIIFGSCIALSASMDAAADFVAPELSTHKPNVVLLADGPFVIDPEGHYLNVHSLTMPSSADLGATNPQQHTGGNRSGGAASGGGGGGQGGTDAEQPGIETRTAPPLTPAPFPITPVPLPTVIAGPEIPQNWATEPGAEPDTLVPQIPIPSAAVLFGSALLGLIGLRFRGLRKRA